MADYEYVIIGNSAGALAAAREIRKADTSNRMLMVSDERYAAYSRPLIAKHLSEGKTIDTMQLVPLEFYENHSIDLRLDTRAVHIDTAARTVSFRHGTTLSWHRLLLATGSLPIVPQVSGTNRRGVFTFTTYDDARQIARHLPAVRHAVVVGGGFIGLSAADALRKRGVDVTVIEMQSRLLSTMLDSTGSSLVQNAAIATGVHVATGRQVISINGDHPESRSVSSVTLDDGTRIQCELVILAVGVRPRTELAESIVSIDRGILVDTSMRTTAQNVFACGDACRTYDFVREQDAVLAIWPNAVAGGAVAGAAMTGQQRFYEGSTTLNAIPYFGLSVGSAGVVEHDPAIQEQVVSEGPGYYRKVILKDGVVVGMVAVGDTSKCGLLHLLMKKKVKVEGCKDILVREDFGLLSLPAHLWHDDLTAVR